MAKNYARESGAFMALATMMRDQVQALENGDDWDRDWAVKCLKMLSDRTNETLVRFGYKVG